MGTQAGAGMANNSMANNSTYDSFGYSANAANGFAGAGTGAGYDQSNQLVDGWFTDGNRNCRRFQVTVLVQREVDHETKLLDKCP